MNINYVAYGTGTETAEPSVTQITVTSSNFTDNKADGVGGLMRLNIDRIKMSITDTIFNTHSATRGGVFYIDAIQQLTLSTVTATDFNAASGGRFIYYSGNAAFTLSTSSSSFTCNSVDSFPT